MKSAGFESIAQVTEADAQTCVKHNSLFNCIGKLETPNQLANGL